MASSVIATTASSDSVRVNIMETDHAFLTEARVGERIRELLMYWIDKMPEPKPKVAFPVSSGPDNELYVRGWSMCPQPPAISSQPSPVAPSCPAETPERIPSKPINPGPVRSTCRSAAKPSIPYEIPAHFFSPYDLRERPMKVESMKEEIEEEPDESDEENDYKAALEKRPKLPVIVYRRKIRFRNRPIPEEYECEVCPYRCTVLEALRKHQLLHVSPEPVREAHSCPICGLDSYTEDEAQTHLNAHRRDNREFECDICPCFKSVQLKKVIQHRRMHTGDKPHLCPHCDYRASRRDNLRSHVRRMHRTEGLKEDTFVPEAHLNFATKRELPESTSAESD